MRILWDFINRFDINLPEERLLEFTNHISFNYDLKILDTGSIEQLEKFISKSKIKGRVIQNLQDENIKILPWINNASYALRNNFEASYPYILKKLEQSTEDEYKFSEILKVWFSKTNKTDRLKEFILNVSASELKWKAILLMEEVGRETGFINEILRQIINNPIKTKENRIYAANHLMKQNDMYGLTYIANQIFENPDPKFNFRINLGSIAGIKDVQAVDTLMQLLVIANRPEFKRELFNDLEERVLLGLRNIGIQSTQNFITVKTAIEEFIEEYKHLFPDVNFLYYSIVNMEEQLKIKYIQTFSIEASLQEYNALWKK